MAEILGVAASAAQLGVTCFSLIDIVRKIKGGASTLKRYHEQLQELQSLSTCISQNPLLQTPEIGTQTDALLYIINNNCLNSLLRKGRVLRTWGFLYREQDLLEIFARLERQKSNLSLAIEQIQSQALYQIRTDIQTMADKKPLIYSTSDFDSETGSGLLVRGGSFGSMSSVPSIPVELQSLNLYIESLLSPKMSSKGFPKQPDPSTGYSTAETPDGQSASQPSQPNNHPSTYNAGAQYNGAVAAPGMNQRNGPTFRGNGALSRELAKNNSTRKNPNYYIYNDSIKIGHGDQHNGRLSQFEGDITGATEPDMNGDVWNSPKAMPWFSSDSGVLNLGTQINGPIVQYKQEEEKESRETGAA